MSKETGVVLWYRPIEGRGMIKTDSGPRMFFYGDHGVEPVAGLRVGFKIVSQDAGGQRAEALRYEHDERNIIDLAPPPKKKAAPKKRAASKAKSTTTKKAASTKKKEPKSGVVKDKDKPKRRVGTALAEKAAVAHPELGAGHVLHSTKTLARVEFYSGVTQTVPAESLTLVEGNN